MVETSQQQKTKDMKDNDKKIAHIVADNKEYDRNNNKKKVLLEDGDQTVQSEYNSNNNNNNALLPEHGNTTIQSFSSSQNSNENDDFAKTLLHKTNNSTSSVVSPARLPDEQNKATDKWHAFSFTDENNNMNNYNGSKRRKLDEIEPINFKASENIHSRIILLRGGFEMILFESGGEKDAYTKQLTDAINQHDTLIVKELGIFAVVSRSQVFMDSENRNILQDSKGFTRRAYIRMTNNSSHQTRITFLSRLCAFMNKNKTNISPIFIVDRPSSDLTPLGNNLDALDKYITTEGVIDIIERCYSNVDITWAINNPSLADYFFDSKRSYPDTACLKLGYDNSKRKKPIIF